jgi:hypothetical protein
METKPTLTPPPQKSGSTNADCVSYRENILNWLTNVYPKDLQKFTDYFYGKTLVGEATYTMDMIDEKIDKTILLMHQPNGVVYNSATDTYEALGHKQPVVQSTMKRCVVDINGDFLYYLHPDDSSKKEDGTDALADLTDGTKQVKVQIQKFYQKRWAEGVLDYYLISLFPFNGAEVHPIFKKAGWTKNDEDFENDFAYIGAYEGVLFDASANTFIDNNKKNDNTANIDLENDRIMSVPNFKPYTGITVVEARQLIANGGSRQFSYHEWDAINMLFLTEYRDYNSQAKIAGFTDGGTVDNIAKTGLTMSLGNKSGSIKNTSNQVDGISLTRVVANSYRGIENFFGHLWKWTDGVNIDAGKPFVCEIFETLESNKYTGQYKQLKDADGVEVQMPTTSNYITRMKSSLFLAKTNTGGGSIKNITDYYWYSSSSNRVLRTGGYLNNGDSVGSFCWNGTYPSDNSHDNIAARS